MSAYINEAQLEIATVHHLREMGYDYVHGPQMAPDGEAPDARTAGRWFSSADCGTLSCASILMCRRRPSRRRHAGG